MQFAESDLNGDIFARLFEEAVEQFEQALFFFEGAEDFAEALAVEFQIVADEVGGAFEVHLGGQAEVEEAVLIEQLQLAEEGVVVGAVFGEAAWKQGLGAYFRDHRGGRAGFNDLVSALQAADPEARRAFVTSRLPMKGRGIEIAPYFNPMVDRAKHDVFYVDCIDNDEIQRKAGENPGAKGRYVPRIDAVWVPGRRTVAFVDWPRGMRMIDVDHGVSRVDPHVLRAEEGHEFAARRDHRLRRHAVPEVGGAAEHVAFDERDVGAGDALAARELVDKLMAQLKPDDQLVIRLLDLEQKTIAEIAALTGSPAGTLLMLIAAAGWGFGTQLIKRTHVEVSIGALTFWMLAVTLYTPAVENCILLDTRDMPTGVSTGGSDIGIWYSVPPTVIGVVLESEKDPHALLDSVDDQIGGEPDP